jgi:hypothetical protein
MKAKLDENLRCGSQLVCESLDTMSIRPNKKISRVATIPSFGHRPSEKAALSSHKTWISQTAVASRLLPITVSC